MCISYPLHGINTGVPSEALFLRVGHIVVRHDLSLGSYDQFIASFCTGLWLTRDFIAALERDLSSVKIDYNLLRR